MKTWGLLHWFIYIQYLYAVTNTCIGNGMCWLCDGRRYTGVSLEARINKIEKLILRKYLPHFQALLIPMSKVEIKMNLNDYQIIETYSFTVIMFCKLSFKLSLQDWKCTSRSKHSSKLRCTVFMLTIPTFKCSEQGICLRGHTYILIMIISKNFFEKIFEE